MTTREAIASKKQEYHKMLFMTIMCPIKVNEFLANKYKPNKFGIIGGTYVRSKYENPRRKSDIASL